MGYAAGADASVNDRLTLVFDVLGRYLINAERISARGLSRAGRQVGVPEYRVLARRRSIRLSGSLGFKVNIVDRLLLDANLLFALDNHGVRDKVTPLIGFEYSF